MFSNKHQQEVRDITAVVQDGLNSVHDRLDQFAHIPPHFLSEIVADAAVEYIATCYDEVKQRNEG